MKLRMAPLSLSELEPWLERYGMAADEAVVMVLDLRSRQVAWLSPAAKILADRQHKALHELGAEIWPTLAQRGRPSSRRLERLRLAWLPGKLSTVALAEAGEQALLVHIVSESIPANLRPMLRRNPNWVCLDPRAHHRQENETETGLANSPVLPSMASPPRVSAPQPASELVTPDPVLQEPITDDAPEAPLQGAFQETFADDVLQEVAAPHSPQEEHKAEANPVNSDKVLLEEPQKDVEEDIEESLTDEAAEEEITEELPWWVATPPATQVVTPNTARQSQPSEELAEVNVGTQDEQGEQEQDVDLDDEEQNNPNDVWLSLPEEAGQEHSLDPSKTQDFESAEAETQPNDEHSSHDTGLDVETPPSTPSHALSMAAPMRFVWEMDADGQILALSPELALAVGSENANIIGQRFSDVAERLGLDPEGRLAVALRKRETWSGQHVLWPVAGEIARFVSIELAGLVVLDENRKFRGYRGFGVIRPHTQPEGNTPAADVTEDAVSPALPEHQEPLRLAQAVGAETFESDETETKETSPISSEETSQESQQTRHSAHLRDVTDASWEDQTHQVLSQEEHSAFEEIAKTLSERLGARRETDDDLAFDDKEPDVITGKSFFHDAADEVIDTPPANVSQQQKTENAVATSNSDEKQAFEHSRETALVLNRVSVPLVVTQLGQVVFANRAFLNLSGDESVEDVVLSGGLNARMAAQPREDEEGFVATTLTLANGQVCAVDVSLQATLWEGVAASLWTIKPQGTQPVQHTEQTDKDEALSASDYAHIARDALFLLDENSCILSSNTTAREWLAPGTGRTNEAIEGQLFSNLVAPENSRDTKAALQDALDETLGALKQTGIEIKLRQQPDHKTFLMHMGTYTPQRAKKGGHEKRIVVILRDITPYKVHEDALEQARHRAENASAHKSDFLARLSHEVRTPLNAILGFAELMLDEPLGPLGHERYREYIRDIHTSGEHVISLINDLLDMAKIEAGKQDMHFEAVDMRAVLEESITLMQPQAMRREVIIRTQLEPLPMVVADRRALRQMALNILSNAVKYNRHGGQVLVSTQLSPTGEALLRVTDQGEGMSEQQLALALEPFGQADPSHERQGTGLGLPLTKALAEANRASFIIESTPGSGTHVEIAFPANRVLAG